MDEESTSEMGSSADSCDLGRRNQRTRRARGNPASFDDGDLIDLSNEEKQGTMESMKEGREYPPSNDTAVTKEKPSFFTQASQVIGLNPFRRGSPQIPNATNGDQLFKTRSKLEAELLALQKTCEKQKKDNRIAVSENNQLRSKLKNAEDQHEITKALARSQAHRHQTDIQASKACSELLKSHLESAGNEILDLKFEITTSDEKLQTAELAAAEDISRLTSYIDTANQELFKEKRFALEEIKQLQSQIKLLNEKNDKFREMLIPVSEKQVLDHEVVQKFTSLRSNLFALVRRTWRLELRENVDLRNLSNDQHYIFRPRGTGDYDRLRYALFQFIHRRILCPRNYFLANGFEGTEQRLQLVERELAEKSPVGNRKLVMEWRSASFKATEPFRGSGRQLSHDTQGEIWNFFGPLQIASPAAEETGRKKLEEICDAAVDFSLIIRQLKEYLWVDDMKAAVGKPVAEWGQSVEEMASVAAGKGKQPGTIAYVIVGALLKAPVENLEKIVVLEKAEVGVYR